MVNYDIAIVMRPPYISVYITFGGPKSVLVICIPLVQFSYDLTLAADILICLSHVELGELGDSMFQLWSMLKDHLG